MVRKKVQLIVRILDRATSINHNHFRTSHLSLINNDWELQRIKREANINQPNLSIIDNFEVLRRRYLDTLRDRRRATGTRRPRVQQKNQIAQNQDFLEAVGWLWWCHLLTWPRDWNLLECYSDDFCFKSQTKKVQTTVSKYLTREKYSYPIF